ncbi:MULTISPECIES: ABC transporter ATP-binding protein [Rhizobium]|uniref:ABC transporter ATP-binding protein n=1 Tax=Rhizobium tropici TaxID=398 RepID=A0A329Y8Z3_RHITR|nr:MULTISPECIES: ABC transporter ATP-binding protein [Rhizobium]MBB3285536.1 peptide/nickel transport system ATP-binding protein [Rhizobium sp. BK252]MBB3400276.1 peptide/nickel transport system ATP-binding protein [Rhizobium sp. BK289]MBB3412855.1 peptide/nickel transport system ATP-binding protein [Rhizobium sp. BK284]MBB3480742.1 peptide/nickel transport system ATP-binding protein [Rhizobium sp. BK347]MDK4719401.1 ABC transporter ATP-binding protein [Rhizobium sp. CNPSo 3968]
MEAVVEVNNLKAYYRAFLYGVDREVRAVDDISLSIGRGEIYGVAGESSSGKTTLIKTIAGAIRPPLRVVSGAVKFHFNGATQDIYAMTPEQRAALRWRHLSYIMQGSMNVLNPVRRIRHSFIDFAFRHMKADRATFFDRVGAHLQRLKLDANLLDAYPHELSGGMRQRMTIALATILTPEFIIADEPTTALDVIVQRDVLQMIREIQREMGSSFLFVTHDMGVHAAVSDRIGIVYAGRLVEEAPTRKLFHLPLHPYTQHLVASLPRIGDASTRPSLEGRPPNLAMPPEGCRFHPRCPKRMDICSREVPPMVAVEPDRRVACFAVTGGGR